MGMLLYKTWGCFGALHGDVLMQNMGMFFGWAIIASIYNALYKEVNKAVRN